MAKKNYYVVWQGHRPGIYDNWPEAESQIKGYKGARFKGFPTLQDAEAAYAGSTPPTPRTAAKTATQPSSVDLINANIDVYCDGACDPNPGPAGTGLAIYRGGVLQGLRYGLYVARGTNNIAELNGLYHALQLAEQAGEPVRIHCDSTYAINAVSTWGYNWKAKGWRTKKGFRPNLEIVEPAHELYDRIKDTVQLLHVRGHSGVEGNELADRMAMYAIQQRETGLAPYSGPLDVTAVLAMKAG